MPSKVEHRQTAYNRQKLFNSYCSEIQSLNNIHCTRKNSYKKTYSIQGGAIKMKMSNLGSSHVIAFDLVNSKNRGLQKENMQLRPKVGFRERLKSKSKSRSDSTDLTISSFGTPVREP